MLSASARPLIHASVPVLREYGEVITRRFYQRMFEAHPELHNVFNLSNQAQGSQPQALAMAVYAYAANIDHPAALEPVLSRIAHKHASVGITPAQYTIVGHHLLGAIGEVLGAAATPALIAAWDEAYWLLALELVAREARLYQAAGFDPRHWRTVRVVERVQETSELVSLHLAALPGEALPTFQPGQYVSVAFDIEALHIRQLRQYSLSGPAGASTWRLTIKREPGDSTHPAALLSHRLQAVEVGERLEVSAPFGDFVLSARAAQAPSVLVSAGVGITPVMSMLFALLKKSQPVVFCYAARDGQSAPFQAELSALAQQHPQLRLWRCFEKPGSADLRGVTHEQEGELSFEGLDPALIAEADAYLCGTIPFMKAQRDALKARGMAGERIHYEVFGPDLFQHLS